VFQHSRHSTRLTDLHGVGRDRPWIFAGFTLAALALAGIPPLSGFFAKDAVIAASLASFNARLLAPLALAGTLLTGAYMARALRILWRGKRRDQPVAGLRWMGVGLAGLVTLAVGLGAAFPFIETLLATPVPEPTLARVFGLSAALGGLTLGWLIPGRRLLGPLLPWAQQGFAVAGGVDAWIVRPALTLARSCERLERTLYAGVMAVGRLGLGIGRAVRRSDDQGIDGLIASLVRGTVNLGNRARALQSGLIHRELAISVVGTALIFAVLFVALLAF
jgi:NADH-quinone oxidoreductase subunit L